MINITHCPSTLIDGFSTYSPKACRKLFDGKRINPILDFDIEQFRNQIDSAKTLHQISVSGVQEKFPGIIKDGKICLAGKTDRSTYILKPAPWDSTLQFRKQIPANEHLTMQIANQIYGIITADNGLCFTPKGQSVYITKRFDINKDGTKLQMEDFATLVGKNEQTEGLHFKYSGSYEDIANIIHINVAAWRVDMERLFELVLFNYIYANGDAHLKNFSLIKMGEDYRLAPAYDLINTDLHIHSDDFGLDGGLSPNIEKSDIYVKTGHACQLDFERFGTLIGIRQTRVQKILNKYTSIPKSVLTLISNSYLNNKMKRSYLRIITERTNRFNRISD